MPFFLNAQEGLLKGLVFKLEDDQEQWTLGRDPDACDFLVEDPKVSRKAGILTKEGEYFYFENLSGSNPALFNGQPIEKKVMLHLEDHLKIGDTTFVLSDQEPVENTPESQDQELSYFTDHHTRWMLKVIAGPNTGAELALDPGSAYLIGSDENACDIVLQDSSVSSEHAKITVSKKEELSIEDLESDNGTTVNDEHIDHPIQIEKSSSVKLGTTTLLLVDTNQSQHTITTAIQQPTEEETEEVKPKEQQEPVEAVLEKKPEQKKKHKNPVFFLLGLMAFLLVGGLLSLWVTKSPHDSTIKEHGSLEAIFAKFPKVRYSFSKTSGKIMILGHISTTLDKNELLYLLQHHNEVKSIDDNVVVDEAIWQEMNIVLSKKPEFRGISMHSPNPGVFVLSGYVKTNHQVTLLNDYMNLHFNYLDLLENRVFIEDQIFEEVSAILLQGGFNGVEVTFTGGELLLTGAIKTTEVDHFDVALESIRRIHGVRLIKDFVIALSPEQAIVDLNEKYPGKYQVSGSSKYGCVNINVVINGKILTRGDHIDGMKIISIQPSVIFLEKDGLKYKIEFSK